MYFRWTPQSIVDRMDPMSPAIPSVEWFTCNIVQHPACTCLHASLVDAITQHVVVVAHDDTTPSINNLALVAFNVKIDTGSILFLYENIIAFKVVPGYSQEGAA